MNDGTKQAGLLAAIGVISVIFAFILGLIILLGGGGGFTASATPGLNTAAVPKPYRQWVVKAGKLCPTTVGPAALAAQLEAESAWNPKATSYAGAQGLAQFMPATWQQWGRDADGDGTTSPFDPADAIMSQGHYMCYLADTVRGYLQSGQVQGSVLNLALAAYNAGPGAVLAAGGIPHNGQTELYVPKIRRLMAKYALLTPSPGGTQLGARIVAAAESQIGTPYVWGGGNFYGPTDGGFDCSGLVMYALYQASGGTITLDKHLADWQVTQGHGVVPPKPGSDVNLARLAPGDIIGFANPGSSDYHHIGIYAGNGQMIHAATFGQPVEVTDLSGSYWQNQTWIVRRFGT